MKVTAAFLLVAGLVCLASGAEDCPDSTVSGKCSAAAALSITATNGTCRGSAGADCKVWTESEQVYEEAVVTWLGQDLTELCTTKSVNATATAIATAVASVWANAFVNLDCPGGFACGWSLANAAALAASVAESVALAVADATASDLVPDTAADAFCYADVRAVGGALAEAFATAQADTCVANGSAQDLQNSYATVIQRTVATALARATVSICASEEVTSDSIATDLSAKSLCEGEASVNRDGTVVEFGDTCARVSDINLCSGKAAKICCKKPKAVCSFSSKQRRKCKDCKAPWIRQKSPGDTVIFLTSKRARCLCDSQAN